MQLSESKGTAVITVPVKQLAQHVLLPQQALDVQVQQACHVCGSLQEVGVM
jgi:hypothetical protein